MMGERLVAEAWRQRPSPRAPPGWVELVERKNIGHPNMICDALLDTIVHALGRMHRGLHQALGVGIPESDYPKLATLEGCGEHLAPLAASPPNQEGLR